MNTAPSQRPANRLAGETSPYLLQHAHNPVDWYPWGEEALARARAEDKPIFLSIGYSACHWCHVMERESFEDEDVAALLNRDFVSIKVDREERPDLDHIYMTAVQMLTGSGGWPMTVFLAPDQRPFFGGTYFPPDNRYGRIGFKVLLERVATLWADKRADIMKSAEEIVRAISAHAAARPPAQGSLHGKLVAQAADQLKQTFDARWGGFGDAPKFPPNGALHLLMREFARGGEEPLLSMVRHTLDHMARGGMYDQVGGGFHRYAVDEKWLVPHFEKMLYDNAQLSMVYTEAWQLTHDPFYREIARATLDYVLRDMTHAQGPFFSSEDADSEGEEGRFYVWSHDALLEVLGEEDGNRAAAFWGATAEGNFEGVNILHVPLPTDTFAKQEGTPPDRLRDQIARWKERLLEARATRVRPALDDKVIAAWNGLMISAFARAGLAFGEPRYVEAARRAAHFILSDMVRDDVLHRTWRGGTAKHPGYLDDYAFLAQGLLDLYEADTHPQWLEAARAWTDRMQREFRDDAAGNFFYTSDTLHRDVLVRSKASYDGAEPSGNSVAAHVLLRLAALTDSETLRREGEAVLQAHAAHMERMPHGLFNMLAALDFLIGPVRELVFAGDPKDESWRALSREVGATYIPNRVIAYAVPGVDTPDHAIWKGKTPVDGKSAVYVCENQTCRAPVTSVEALRAELGGNQ